MDDLEAFEAERWLSWAVSRARRWAIDDRELVDRLQPGLSGQVREDVMREVERRLEQWNASDVDEFLHALTRLEREHRQPGRSAQDVDRMLQRLLRYLPDGAELAFTCLVSSRLARRRAAWRYYRQHGIPSAAVPTLASHLDAKPEPELVRLAAGSLDILRLVPLEPLLESVREFYWRGRIIQTLSTAGHDDAIRDLAAGWPGEVIFALRRTGRHDMVDLVTKLLDENPEDANVITGAIQAYGSFGRTTEMLHAAKIGEVLLADVNRLIKTRYPTTIDDA